MEFIPIDPPTTTIATNRTAPRLESAQTAHLRDEYPCIEWLEQGHAGNWLMDRKQQLLAFAEQERSGIAISKTLGLVTTAAGLLLHATSPVAPISAIFGIAGLAWAVLKDKEQTHTFAPFPFIRDGVLDVAGRLGNASLREEHQGADEFEQLKTYLPPVEQKEYQLLRDYLPLITDYLAQVEPLKRFHAYRWILHCFIEMKGFPHIESLHKHMENVLGDVRVNTEHLIAIQEMEVGQQTVLPSSQPSKPVEFLKYEPEILPRAEEAGGQGVGSRGDRQFTGVQKTTNFQDSSFPPCTLPSTPLPDYVSVTTGEKTEEKVVNTTKTTNTINATKLLAMPLEERAGTVIELMNNSGFDIARTVEDQITVVCGNQRGGKGTLVGMLAILSKASSPNTRVHYFTAGTDIYPFKCDKLVCAINYEQAQNPDAKVAAELYNYLQILSKSRVGSVNDLVLVIDEAVTLSEHLSDSQKQWMVNFILTRCAKLGCQVFLVVHGNNLTAWVGSATAGKAQVFKTGATFVGCEATSKKTSAFKPIKYATGRYFIADPDNFGKSIDGGEVGMVPEWLKTQTNPATSQPDPVRSLLKLFPELYDESPCITSSKVTFNDTPVDEIKEPELTLEAEFNGVVQEKINKEMSPKVKAFWHILQKNLVDNPSITVIQISRWTSIKEFFDPTSPDNKVDQIRVWVNEIKSKTGVIDFDGDTIQLI